MSRRAPMGLPADKLVGETPAEYACRQKPWGTGLPTLGAEVAILHGRDDDEHLCVVVGYEVWPSLQKPHDPFNHRVLVHVVYKGSDTRNCRHLHELLPVSERTVARWERGQHAPHELGPDGKDWAATQAAYRHVEGAAANADSCSGSAPLWHGWALRQAFIAGAEWQQSRTALKKRGALVGHAYLATHPQSGLLTGMAWDEPERARETAKSVATWVRRGDHVTRIARFKGDEIPRFHHDNKDTEERNGG